MDELIKDLRIYANDETDEMRFKAADAIEELTGFVQEAERDRDEYRERLDKANDAIEELSAAEKKYLANISALETENQHLKRERYWIPVTERLPEVRTWVLCYCRANSFDVFRMTDEGHWQYGNRSIYMKGYVTHWMPLPEPPKEET